MNYKWLLKSESIWKVARKFELIWLNNFYKQLTLITILLWLTTTSTTSFISNNSNSIHLGPWLCRMLRGWGPAAGGRTAPASSACGQSLLWWRRHRSFVRPQASEGSCSTHPLQPEDLMAPAAAQARCTHHGPRQPVHSSTTGREINTGHLPNACKSL